MTKAKRNLNLKPEEQQILTAFESGKLTPVADSNELQRARSAARRTIVKDQRINIRLTTTDLEALQTMALEEGLPYQSLITSILHKYVTGRLVDRGRSPRDRRG